MGAKQARYVIAHGDIKGSSAGKKLGQAFDRARLMEELASEQESNIEVGDFLSELAAAIRFRMKLGQSQGDWIEEPERMFSDGLIFATEEAVASEVKLQITLSLDTSTSMWMNKIMKHAGPAVLAFDRIIRKAMQDLPQGSVTYQPFIFHGTAHPVPAAYLNSYVGKAVWASGQDADQTIWPNYPRQEQLRAAKEAGEAPEGAGVHDYKLSGEDTRIAPLFKVIQDWEQIHGDPNAVRLDIVITDGVLEEDGDVEIATGVQEERNGKLRTVLLNFLPLDQWSNYQLPDRCAQFAVDAENLDRSVRDILSEAVADLFA
jgi:hypothetical protein